MERAILIHFNKTTGAVEIEAQGFEGHSCLEATQPFEEALGIVQERDRTYKTEAEIRQIRRTTQSQQQRTRQ